MSDQLTILLTDWWVPPYVDDEDTGLVVQDAEGNPQPYRVVFRGREHWSERDALVLEPIEEGQAQ